MHVVCKRFESYPLAPEGGGGWGEGGGAACFQILRGL